MQLPDDLQRSIRAVQLRSRRNMLPGLQKLFEIERGNWLDLAPQTALAWRDECAPECADYTTRISPAVFAKMSAQHLPLRFQPHSAASTASRANATCPASSGTVIGPNDSIQPAHYRIRVIGNGHAFGRHPKRIIRSA